MGIRIDLDTVAIGRLEEAARRAAGLTIEALRGEVVSAQVMPFDTGDMQNNQTFTVVEADKEEVSAKLVTGSPQARRLYYHPEYNFQKVNNPGAGGKWLELWIEGENKDFLEETFREKYRKEAGL